MTTERISELFELLTEATGETIYMTFWSTLIAYIFGILMGIVLIVTNKDGVHPNKYVNTILGAIVNFGRSVPFIILLIAVVPLTRFLVGTSLGTKATVVPLVVAASPYIARLVESSLKEVDYGVIEAAQSMGATTWQIVWRVLLPEARPSLIVGATIVVTTVISYSAMAGTVAGGGLGSLAISLGYYRYQTDVTVFTIIILVLMVQIVQTIGDALSKKFDRRIS